MDNKEVNYKPSLKEKVVDKTGGTIEKVGTASRAVGTATSAVGKTARLAGNTAKYGGKAVKYTGKGVSAVGKGTMEAGSSLSSTGVGAIVGVPLSVVGGITTAAGKTAEVAGTGVEKTGEAVDKAGKVIDEAGKKMREFGKESQKTGRQIKNSNNGGHSGSKRKNKDTMKKLAEDPFSPPPKMIIMFSLSGFVFLLLMFFMIMFVPLIVLGVVTVDATDGIGGSYSSTNVGYTRVSNNVEYWVAIGSSQSTQNNGRTYASGDPINCKITSSFGYRIDPYTNETRYHSGIDIAPSSGSYGYDDINIIAAKSGTVTTAKNDPNCESNANNEVCNGSSYGNYIIIQHDDGIVTVYGHLHKNTITVKEGDKVDQGQVIAKMGSSGRSTGMHLHFEVRENGTAVDPQNFISFDNARPISKSTNNKEENEGEQNE